MESQSSNLQQMNPQRKAVKPMLPLADALARLVTTISQQLQLCSTSVAIDGALDRTLAEDVYSPLPVPTATNSAMDGYALRFADATADSNQQWPLIGQSLAGHP